jgi:hypothetical protein
MIKPTLNDTILTVLFFVGSIFHGDLIDLVTPYSKNPQRLIKTIKDKNLVIHEKSKNLITLDPISTKLLSEKYLIKATKSTIDNHDLITAKALFWCIQNLEISKIELEKRITGTSLQVDLYIHTKDNLELYIESDNGTEGEKELNNKVINYDNLDLSNSKIIFITNHNRSLEQLNQLTEARPKMRVLDIGTLDEKMSNAIFKETNSSFITTNTINSLDPNNLDMNQIQKYILSL